MDLKEMDVHTRNLDDSAQDRDYWRSLVNAALNLQAPKVMELVSALGECGMHLPKSVYSNTVIQLIVFAYCSDIY